MDVDGTHIRWQLFYHLIIGMVKNGLFPSVVLARMDEALDRYRNREGPFEAFIVEALKAYQEEQRMRGIRVSDVRVVARQVISEQGKRVHVFTRELITAAKKFDYMTAFISGSPTEAVKELAKFYGVDAWIGTEHPHAYGFYTGGKPKEWAKNKRTAVKRLQIEHSIDLAQSIAIGDSEGDIPMLKMVGYPIVFNPNRNLYYTARMKRHDWPIVVEKKFIYIDRFDKHGDRIKTDLWGILPKALANYLSISIGVLELLP
jgi:HAD superfamily hydrolase (TIGR01490 family)